MALPKEHATRSDATSEIRIRTLAEQKKRIGADAKGRIVRLAQFAQPSLPDDTIGQLSARAISEQTQRLLALDFSPADFLSRSATLAGQYHRLLDTSISELGAADQDYDSVSGRLDGLAPGALQRARLERQQADLAQQRETQRPELAELEEQAREFFERRNEALIAVATDEVRTISDNYERFLGAIKEDKSIIKEVQDLYIKQAIVPEAEKRVAEGNATQEKTDTFFENLAEYLSNPNKDAKASLVWEARKLFGISDDNSSAPVFQLIKNRCDIEGVVEFIYRQVAQDIQAITEIISNTGDVRYSSYEVEEKIIGGRAKLNAFGESVHIVLRPAVPFMHHHQIELLQTIKSSSLAQALFGEEIERRDQTAYESALRLSLEAGMNFDTRPLQYYPTPEAIRNMVLLVAAGKSITVNDTLAQLAKRDDWSQRLEQVHLGDALPILAHWQHTGSSPHPAIFPNADTFLEGVIRANPDNKTLIEIAWQGLSTRRLVDIEVEKGVVSESTAAVLKTALQIVKSTTEQTGQENNFANKIRQILLGPDKKYPQKIIEKLARLAALGTYMMKVRDDSTVLTYLNAQELIRWFINKQTFTREDMQFVTDAYKRIPTLAVNPDENSSLLNVFFKLYSGRETIDYFVTVGRLYAGHEKKLIQLLDTLKGTGLSKERVLELGQSAQSLLGTPEFETAQKFSTIILTYDEGVRLLVHIKEHGLGTLGNDMDKFVGEKGLALRKKYRKGFSEFIDSMTVNMFTRLANQDSLPPTTAENWMSHLSTFIAFHNGTGFPKLSEQLEKEINERFSDPQIKNFCLAEFRSLWRIYLAGDNGKQVPFSLAFLTDFLQRYGAIDLSHFDAQSLFISAYIDIQEREDMSPKSKSSIQSGIAAIEERFITEDWSNDDRKRFYLISAAVMGASPALFEKYLALFASFTPAQLLAFTRNVYPSYLVKIEMIGRLEDNKRIYDDEGLREIEGSIDKLHQLMRIDPKSNHFSTIYSELRQDIKQRFKGKFGIIKAPESFTEEQMRSISNISIYMVNIQNRTPQKEALLGFYLALIINNKWEAFRKGEEIDPAQYLTKDFAIMIGEMLTKRKETSPLTPDNLGISVDEIAKFQKILQAETSQVHATDIETIDVKLLNIVSNIRDLADLDLYPDPLDKFRMELAMHYGNRVIGKTASKMYQSFRSSQIDFTSDEQEVRERIISFFREKNMELTQDALTRDFQNGMKPFALVANILHIVDESDADKQVEILRKLLSPPQDIVAIFNRLGEEFTPTSGALALSQDLDYLDSVMVKKGESLKEDERGALQQYTNAIRQQMIQLETIYEQINSKFSGLTQGNTQTGNQQLVEKLAEITRAMNSQTTAQPVVSTITNDLNSIIENIRECLSCTTQGSNNDTNLTFGDSNKFYLFSKVETDSKKNIADQVVFLEPTVYADGTSDMAFVMDRLYGTRTPSILLSQVGTMMKKYEEIKRQFPQIELSVFIPEATLASAGLSAQLAQDKLSQGPYANLSIAAIDAEIDVVPSALGDHYTEFVGMVRGSGKKNVSGIRITLG